MIQRNVQEATSRTYDMLIIGGGVYGIALAHQAACRGLSCLLLEQNDFASATSTNSLRIVHGGLRYLQSLDLHRFFESVAERRWFLKTFGSMARPLACLMPLYNRGLHRSWILGGALAVNDVLSAHRNSGVFRDSHLPRGKIVTADRVRKIFPDVDTRGLRSGGIWYDGTVDCPQRVLIEWLKMAVRKGAAALNYMQAEKIVTEQGRIVGIVAVDRTSNLKHSFRSDLVVNAAGPWCRQLAERFDRDYAHLFHRSIAWNVLFDRPPLSDHALAITPPLAHARTYFLRPWRGLLLAGTVHEPYTGSVVAHPMPSDVSIRRYIDALNLSIPGINLDASEIIHIFSGLLPAKKQGSDRLAVREVLLDHGMTGGPKGLFTISGVKFTTARRVAEKTLKRIHRTGRLPMVGASDMPSVADGPDPTIGIFPPDWVPQQADDHWQDRLRSIIRNESVVHLDDLMIRRTTLGDHPQRAMAMADRVCTCFAWDSHRKLNEMNRLRLSYPFLTDQTRG